MSTHKRITCMLTKPIALEVMQQIREQKGIITANFKFARGTSSQSMYTMKSVEMLTVVVPSAFADEMFVFLYELLEIDKPHHGMIYQEALRRATQYDLSALEGEANKIIDEHQHVDEVLK